MSYHGDVLARVRRHRILHEATLELTYACNLDCDFCYNDRAKRGRPLSLAQYEALLRDLARMQTLFLMLTGGEPMVHPHFFDIGRLARELGFVVRVRTNGHSLRGRSLRRLREEVDPWLVEVSLHGASAEVHDRQTRVPGSFERLMENLRQAGEIGLRCAAVCTPTRWNQHQIAQMYALCDALGIPLRFQGPVAPRDNGDRSPLRLQPDPAVWDEIERLHRRRRPTGEAAETAPGPQAAEATCGVGTMGVDIDPYGNVRACMHLQRSAGSLHEQSIEQIWRDSPVFRAARGRAVEAAQRLEGAKPNQLGAPLYCIAVEENLAKGDRGGCAGCR